MKTTILLLAVIMAASPSTGQNYDTGAYIHDNSGAYVQDYDTGAYIHDNPGAYVQDYDRSDDSDILFTPFEWAPGCLVFPLPDSHPLCHRIECFENSDPLCDEEHLRECLHQPNQCKCRHFINPGHPLSNPIHWQHCDL